MDLFSGRFDRSSKGRPIHPFGSDEVDIANSVKWAIESATKIRCFYRGRQLVAEATPTTARKLQKIARDIASSFRALVERFNRVDGVSAADHGVFVMGLYDGMMNETRELGQPLPSRPGGASRSKRKNLPRPASPPFTSTLTLWLSASAGKSASPHPWNRSPRNWTWRRRNAWPSTTDSCQGGKRNNSWQ